jgi:hypothetical protein
MLALRRRRHLPLPPEDAAAGQRSPGSRVDPAEDETMKTKLTAAAAALICLAGCTAPRGLTARQQASQRALASARDVGPPENCVVRSHIRQTVVLDDQTIDFHMAGGRILRNRLPGACPGLAFDDSFSYRTSLDRLCSVDTITVVRSGGPGATCGLGRFQPVELPGR